MTSVLYIKQSQNLSVASTGNKSAKSVDAYVNCLLQAICICSSRIQPFG